MRLLVIAVMLVVALVKSAEPSCSPPNVTASLVTLGNPAAAIYPGYLIARNVWDLKLHDGRVFIGHGDLDINSVSGIGGQAPILFWDTSSAQFGQESFIKDEGIFFFRDCGAMLCFAGIDATAEIGWDYDYVYFRQSGGWVKHPVFLARHLLDIFQFGDKLFVAANVTDPAQTPADFTGIFQSVDGGATWASIQQFPEERGGVSFFTFHNRLYADVFRPDPNLPAPQWYLFDEASSPPFQPVTANLLPDQENLPYVPVISRGSVEWGGRLVYLEALIANIDISGLWVATSLTHTRRVILPDNARARDILKVSLPGKAKRILVLTSTRQAGGSYRNAVFESTNLATWTKRFWFTSETFVRAFEYDGSRFYFGLGGWGTGPCLYGDAYLDNGNWTDTGVHPDVGDILSLEEPARCTEHGGTLSDHPRR